MDDPGHLFQSGRAEPKCHKMLTHVSDGAVRVQNDGTVISLLRGMPLGIAHDSAIRRPPLQFGPFIEHLMGIPWLRISPFCGWELFFDSLALAAHLTLFFDRHLRIKVRPLCRSLNSICACIITISAPPHRKNQQEISTASY